MQLIVSSPFQPIVFHNTGSPTFGLRVTAYSKSRKYGTLTFIVTIRKPITAQLYSVLPFYVQCVNSSGNIFAI